MCLEITKGLQVVCSRLGFLIKVNGVKRFIFIIKISKGHISSSFDSNN